MAVVAAAGAWGGAVGDPGAPGGRTHPANDRSSLSVRARPTTSAAAALTAPTRASAADPSACLAIPSAAVGLLNCSRCCYCCTRDCTEKPGKQK